jgi:hypothetical protein
MAKYLPNDQKIWYISMDTAEHLQSLSKEGNITVLNTQKNSLYGIEFGCRNGVNLWRQKKKTTWPPSNRTRRHGLD